MPAPTTTADLVAILRRSGLVEPARLDAHLLARPADGLRPKDLARQLLADGLLTPFQADQLLKGKHRGFFLGKYKLLDRIGMGGMGQVFLAEHGAMRRRCAVKVLPPDRADNQFTKERFLREARAIGQLDHPNLVRAFDVDTDGDVCFLVMEFVDGVTFHDLVCRFGPLTPHRAAHYLMQSARGLDYLHTLGLVHRDVKPANLLVDRQGCVKLLDLGLVRSEAEGDELTRAEGVKILGTADYLAPEQAVDCSTVDVRADLYALGATGYFLLTGKAPFEDNQAASKLLAHQMMPTKPVHELNPAVPPELTAVIDRLMAKKPADRYQTPAELVAALAPWTTAPPAPPTDAEIPAISAGAYANASSGVNFSAKPPAVGGGQSSNSSNVRYNLDQQSSAAGMQLAITPPPVKPAEPPAALPVKPAGPPVLLARVAYARPGAAQPVAEAAAAPWLLPVPKPPAARPLAEPARPAVAPRKGQRWAPAVIGFALVVAVAGWNVAQVSGATKPPATEQVRR